MLNRPQETDKPPPTSECSSRVLLSNICELPIDEITREQIQTQIDHVAIQSGKAAAHYCSSVMSVFFKWAIKTGKLPEAHRDPMTNVEPPKLNAPRERVLTDDEIRLIWKTCEAWETEALHYQSTGKRSHAGAAPMTDDPRGIMLLFLTGCRAQEIGDLRWDEVDLDNSQLLIPKTRTKNEEDLCNPLSDWAVQILRRVERRPGRNEIFRRTKNGRNMQGVLRRIDRRIVRTGGTLPKHWTPHDIRRTFRTRMAALGVTADVAEALVGHVGHRTQDLDRVLSFPQWAKLAGLSERTGRVSSSAATGQGSCS
jgi:integrase